MFPGACRVRYGRVNQDQLTDILITDPDVHHQEISGLEKGIEYEFRVAGVNTVGPGQVKPVFRIRIGSGFSQARGSVSGFGIQIRILEGKNDSQK
jgi:hypothetical protein